MVHFPQEILGLIVKHLPRDDLFRVRLVNHAFATASAPYLFQTLPLWLGTSGLDHLTKVSEHSVLSTYVKRIMFSTLRIIEYPKEEHALHWIMHEWKNRQTYLEPRPSRPHLRYLRNVLAYKEYVNAQRTIAQDQHDIKTTVNAFSKLPNLRDIIVGWADHADHDLEFINTLIDFGGCYVISMMLESITKSGQHLRRLHIGQHADFAWSTSTELTDTSARKCPQRIILDEACSTSAEEYNVQRNGSGLLELVIEPTAEFAWMLEQDLEKTTLAIRQFAQTSGALESIEIGHSDNAPNIDLNSILPTMTRSLLKKLHLYDVQFPLGQILDLISRHSKTLQDIDLSHSEVTDDCWLFTVTQLRKINFESLKSFIILVPDDNIIGRPMEVQDFILGRVDGNPLKKPKGHHATSHAQPLA